MDCKNVFYRSSKDPCPKTYTQLWIRLIMQAAREKTALDIQEENEWRR